MEEINRKIFLNSLSERLFEYEYLRFEKEINDEYHEFSQQEYD